MSYPSKSSPSLAVTVLATIVEGLALFAFFIIIMALAAVLANHSF